MPDLPRAVLLITERYPPHAGGLARSSRRLAAHAATSGIRTHVLVTRGEGAPGSMVSERDGEVWVHRAGGAREAVEARLQVASVIAWLHAAEAFDLLHGQYASTSGFLAAYQARLLDTASYVSLRGNDLDRDAYDPARFPALLWALRHADAVGGVSRALARAASALADRSDVRYTPNSVDGELFQPGEPDPELRAGLGLDDGPVIGFAGELRHKKGALFILEAFRAVAAAGAQLLLVGTVRPDERRALDAFLEEEPALAARVRSVPYVQDPAALAALYRVMDVFLSPSLWEGMPNAVLEAMACGRTVLASDAGGIPDVIENGETGWLLGRHQLHRLGDALREVLDLPAAERAAVGVRARERVLRDFSPGRERVELMAAYAVALARRNSRKGHS